MKTSDFCHLHVHSDASTLDGLGRVERLVEAAASKGFNKLALTDHGTLANAVLFTIACHNHGIKPIMGCEGYIEVDGKIGHITLLADGQEGWASLVKLNNTAHAAWTTAKRPAFTISDLIAHKKNLIILTGCMASPLNEMSEADALSLGARLKSEFEDRMYAEVMFVSDTDTWRRPILLAEKLGLKLVVTNDVHFPNKDDAVVHPTLTKMKGGFEYNSRNLYLRNPGELLEASMGRVDAERVKSMLENAGKLGDAIMPVTLARTPELPAVPEADSVLLANTLEALRSRFPGYEQLAERAMWELTIIRAMGYSAYFLILADITNAARAQHTRVGPGRGSGAASAVLYALGVTDIDPLEHNLSFERFLNPSRKGMPDVDMDFDSEHRKLVIDYATERWGAVPVATYTRYSHKTLVHDLGKFHHIPRDEEEAAADAGPDSKEFKAMVEKNPGFGREYNTILGQIRNRGKHAGGVVITNAAVPIERAGDALVAAWTEGEERELSYAGVVKFDLLGLSALSVLNRLEHRFDMKAPPPDDDSPVFELFRKGDLAGIFQFTGSSGIIELTKKVAPQKFEDLVAINALYRPGALDVGSTEMYPEWKKTPRVVPSYIEDILAETYGAVVYQEQVMAIFARITKGTLAEADLARRIIVKSKVGDLKWEEEFAALEDKFVESAIANYGATERDARKLWSELASHSRYSFNKAHAVAYSMVAWEMAWWKYHKPVEFYCEMLNVDESESQTYIFDAVEHGIPVVPPHVQHSTGEYVAKDGSIYMPLSAVKFLGDPGASAIINARATGGDFKSFADFMSRVPKKLVRGKAREGLYVLGAFSGLEPGATPIKTLGIDPPIEAFGADPLVRQKDYLGFIVPTPHIMDAIIKAQNAGMVAGIISAIKEKTSRYGPYKVYYLMPRGIFWSRDGLALETGDVVAAKTSKKTGKAEHVSKMKRAE